MSALTERMRRDIHEHSSLDEVVAPYRDSRGEDCLIYSTTVQTRDLLALLEAFELTEAFVAAERVWDAVNSETPQLERARALKRYVDAKVSPWVALENANARAGRETQR